MEDSTKITNPNPSSADNSEKTVVMSSNQNQAKQKPADQEKTQINEPSKDPKIDNNSDAQQDSAKSAKDFVADLKDKKSISPGMAAAGAALSGVAGVALGASFSEEIKAAFALPISEEEANSTEDVPVAEETNSSENGSVAEGTNSVVGVPVSDEAPVEGMSDSSVDELPPLPEMEPDVSHRVEFSATDAEGNVISVSFLDIDGDGQIENQTMEFQLVDGTSIYFSESGNSLEPFFSEDFQLASANDYVSAGFCSVTDVSMMDSFLYPIQPGDTLSEIAAANNTSIAHLLELNPQISDPNVILAGHNLIVPEGDDISNPYENWDQGYESPLVADGSYFVDEIEESSTGEFETIDWQSYYESPVENPYNSELAQMDFETMETPQSYYETDYDMGDYGTEESGFGFL
jgi:LysM repeat protein